MNKSILLFFLLSFACVTASQAQHILEIAHINVTGNKKTKTKIVEREITFKVGDRLARQQLEEIIERSRQNIQNTGLFIKTEVDTLFEGNQLTINFIVTETWYIYPFVIFELADRNFNVWWKEQNRSLERVNFGVRGVHLNLTGNRDKLKLTVQDGYTKKYELDYFIPGVNKAQTLGFFTNVFFSRQREIAHITQENKLGFYSFDEEFQLRRFRIGGGLSYRPGFYSTQTYKITYSDNSISDDVAFVENPDYFFNNSTNQRHFTLEYNFTYDNRDIKPFPLSGRLFSASIQKDGFGFFNDVNALKTVLTYQHYFPFTEKISLAVIGSTKINILRHKQPYTHVSSLGWGDDVLTGYELFVVDGLDHGYIKSAFRFQLLNREFNWGKLMFVKRLKQMPLKLYFVVNNDVGYVNSPFFDSYGDLNNQALWGGGVGLHLVVYFDKVIEIEYNINKFGDRGLFLNFDFSL